MKKIIEKIKSWFVRKEIKKYEHNPLYDTGHLLDSITVILDRKK